MSRSSRRMILALRVLGNSAAKKISSGFAIEPIFVETCAINSFFQRVAGGDPFLQRDERGNSLAFDFVRLADHGRFGHGRVIHQRALNLECGDAVSGDVHDVIDAPQQPEISIVVELAAIAGEILSRIARPLILHVALGIPI